MPGAGSIVGHPVVYPTQDVECGVCNSIVKGVSLNKHWIVSCQHNVRAWKISMLEHKEAIQGSLDKNDSDKYFALLNSQHAHEQSRPIFRSEGATAGPQSVTSTASMRASFSAMDPRSRHDAVSIPTYDASQTYVRASDFAQLMQRHLLALQPTNSTQVAEPSAMSPPIRCLESIDSGDLFNVDSFVDDIVQPTAGVATGDTPNQRYEAVSLIQLMLSTPS
jgi:hypothetical protein